MKTSFRDNAIDRNHLLLRLTLVWAVSVSVVAILITMLCFYGFMHQETHWIPVCTGSEFSIGGMSYSPEYLKEMTQKVADLRLTYNPETIDSRYMNLSHLIETRRQESFTKVLDEERATVKQKNISSVFYAEKISVDVASSAAIIKGSLVRTSHGLQLNPQQKTYRLQFSFHNGLLSLQSIKEVIDERTH